MDKRIKVLSNLSWRFGERVCSRIVSFVVTIIIARILDPSDYGVIAMVNVFIEFADVIVASGFGSAVIQKKDADELDYSSAFYFQLFLSAFMYAIIFFFSPYIQRFYGNQYELLTPVLRVLSLRLFLVALNSMQNAYVSKHLQYKKFFFATMIGTVISAIVGIASAYRGLGVWALVIQYLVDSIVNSLVLWITVEWHPILRFSFFRLKKLYSYGWKLLATSLLDIGYQKIRDLLIAKVYTSSDLAYYSRGMSYPNLIVTNINTSIDNVIFPVMANVQNDTNLVKAMARRSIKISSYIMFPMMMGLAICGETLIRLMLTDKWMPAVPYLQIFCFVYAWQPVNTANLNAIKAMGRSDLYLFLGILKSIIGIIAVVVSVKYGVLWVAFSSAITAILGSLINAFPNKKLMNYSYFEQLKDLAPSAILTLIMSIPVYLINLLCFSDIIKLCIQIFLGIIIYVGLSMLIKVDSFTYLLDILKKFLKHK